VETLKPYNQKEKGLGKKKEEGKPVLVCDLSGEILWSLVHLRGGGVRGKVVAWLAFTFRRYNGVKKRKDELAGIEREEFLDIHWLFRGSWGKDWVKGRGSSRTAGGLDCGRD